MRRFVLAAGAALALAGAPGATAADATPAIELAAAAAAPRAPTVDQRFAAWLKEFRATAIAAGVKPATYDAATAKIAYNRDVVERNAKQPELTRPVWVYLRNAASDQRISKGIGLRADYRKLLRQISQTYGVSPEIILAIWGLETGFGEDMGGFNVIEALATLGFEGRRAEFGRTEMIAALKIIDQGHVKMANMVGSWAGAMGHTQFTPTTFLRTAVDHNGDGKRDIWGNMGDVFASTANHLAESGWHKGESWGFEVRLPKYFAYADADPTIVKTLGDWIDRGVVRIDGKPLTQGGMPRTAPAAIFVPAGHTGAAFVLFDNFRAILKYNNSTFYALAIGHLADRIAGGGPIVKSWPVDDPLLTAEERLELQQLLVKLGYDVGDVDGVIGRKSRAALREIQAKYGFVADGYPTKALLIKLRKVVT